MDKNGNLTATNGTFSGTINSSSGTIGGWTIGRDTLSGGDVTLNSNGNIVGAHISGGTVEAGQLSLNGKVIGWQRYQVITALSGAVTTEKI